MPILLAVTAADGFADVFADKDEAASYEDSPRDHGVGGHGRCTDKLDVGD